MVPPNRHRDVFSKSQGYVFVFQVEYPAIQSKPGTELFFARPYWDPRQKTTRKGLLNEDSVSRKLFCYTHCSFKMHACYTYMFGTQTEDYQKGTSEWEEGWGRNNKMVPPNRHKDVFSKSQGYVFVFQVESQLSRASQAQSSSLLDLIGIPDRRLPERDFWMKILSQGNCSATLIALSRCMHATPTCLGPRQKTTRKGLLNDKKVWGRNNKLVPQTGTEMYSASLKDMCLFSGGIPAIQSKPGTELFFARPYWDPRQKTTRTGTSEWEEGLGRNNNLVPRQAQRCIQQVSRICVFLWVLGGC